MPVIDNKILDHQQIHHKIMRISYQIYETFVDEDEIIIAGISGGGLTFAKKIHEAFEKISDIKMILCEVKIDKENLLSGIKTSLSEEEYTNKSVVLVDDVLNSGGTLIYAVRHFLNVPLRKFKTVVLVDRNHKKYPVKADFKGISLSTSLHEHVEVSFKANDYSVYLT
ncbi:phosphoribosyltransferase family protein [Abyssalbus ytuae]|uniref:Phosphoribosyltransferase n=1 Tax=Abyssalbus ytuae TaxID=2926907 RepID=A0A9E7A009_9FLAO|nr:phosphoribosyltransferase family protein [Abyssalbus ytuae]UOB18292.1 phosphoribosyltransferase [Abyssalbus ytuae]